MRYRRRLTAALLLGALLLTGCGAEQAAAENDATDTSAAPVEPGDAVWITYWDEQPTEEQLASLGAEKVCLFSAYFDESGTLAVPEATQELAEQMKELNQYTLYLSVVNDVVYQDRENSLKDTELLVSLLGTKKAAQRHVSALLDAAEAYGMDGIEIDYERIRDDYDLWDDFIRFLELLLPEAATRGLAVRVLLEPSTPIEKLELPEGPEYVVMCYNLYGSGTEPGPKADREFLLSLKQQFGAVANMGYALANGGYRWDESGEVTSLTVSEAVALADEKGAAPTRDADNGALSFTYEEDGASYTVWYGDDETLEFWAEILNEGESSPASVSTWRLNG